MLAGCLSLPSHRSSSSISLLFILKWNHPLYDLADPMISASLQMQSPSDQPGVGLWTSEMATSS